MLHTLLKRALIPLVMLALGGGAVAQEAPAPENMRGPQISPEDRAQLESITNLIKANAAAAAADKDVQKDMAQITRRIDDMANKEMAGDREKVLKFLELDPNRNASLYIFVSWSMPLEMLRAYAMEAMWTGGYLVFRGIPPGRTIGDFLMKDLRQLVYDKGASSVISLDPRLYDTYSIEVVPTIVLTTDRKNPLCAGAGLRDVKLKDGSITHYRLCPKMDPAKYWKMAGAVTVDYALQAFQSSGAEEATPLLNALAKGYRGSATKEQHPFTGDWKEAPSPSKEMSPVAPEPK